MATFFVSSSYGFYHFSVLYASLRDVHEHWPQSPRQLKECIYDTAITTAVIFAGSRVKIGVEKKPLRTETKSIILFAAPMVAAEERRIHQLNPRPLDLLFLLPVHFLLSASLGNLARSSSGLDSGRLSMTSLITALPADRSLPAVLPPGAFSLSSPALSYPFHAEAIVGSLCGIRVPHRPRLEAHKHALIHS